MKKVLLCGLGAVGVTFGVKLNNTKDVHLHIVLDKIRIEKYRPKKILFNGIEQKFNYILPDDINEPFDLIIISTKAGGLSGAITSIKNAVGKNTRIISLINGISSEEYIKEAFPQAKVLKSYFIGHSAVRTGDYITQDGVAEIVCEKDDIIKEIFENANIDYSFPDDIEYQMWVKYALNLFSNQVSAILNLTFGEMKNNKKFIIFAKKIIAEVVEIAKRKGINSIENLETDSLNALMKMCDEGKTSMLQDILANRKTEVDIFAGEIIKLGEKYNIETPYNKVLYDLIKIKENNNEYSIHSC